MTVEDFNLNDLVSWSKEKDIFLSLNTRSIAILLALSFVQNNDEGELNEPMLMDIIQTVHKMFDDTEATENAINNIINSLVEQKLLNRFKFDISVEERSIYRLSSLASAIADYYLRQRQFSSLALSLQLKIISEEMVRAAENANQENITLETLRYKVYAPLKYSIYEIFTLIDYRQRELDGEQNGIRQKIADLLRKDWQDAIIACQSLLDETSNILGDLRDTLSVSAEKLHSGLLSIQYDLNKQYNNTTFDDNNQELQAIYNELFSLIKNLQTRLDNAVNWGQTSIDLWIKFDKEVHKFIRDAIDLDKDRVFSQRLRRSISSYLEAPWFLVTSTTEGLIELRDENAVYVDAEDFGEVDSKIEFEDYVNISDKMREYIQEIVNPYYTEKQEINFSIIISKLLESHPNSIHFDLTRIFIEQAMSLGISDDDLRGLNPEWKTVNTEGAQVQAHSINKYI